jgi:hypothetical protein
MPRLRREGGKRVPRERRASIPFDVGNDLRLAGIPTVFALARLSVVDTNADPTSRGR